MIFYTILTLHTLDSNAMNPQANDFPGLVLFILIQKYGLSNTPQL